MTLPLPISRDIRAPGSLRLDPRTYGRGLSCVHCGLCLPACPTYTTSHDEAESPRGRIQLMLALSDGRVKLTSPVRAALDTCLDCRACETACPSSVIYHELIEEMRERIASTTSSSGPSDRLLRWLIFEVFPYPDRLKRLLIPLRIPGVRSILKMLQRLHIGRVLPQRYQGLFEMLPLDARASTVRPSRPPMPSQQRQARVTFFAGCVGQVFMGHVDQMTAELLAFTGARVVQLTDAGCCGAIHHHSGDADTARKFARKVIDATFSGDRPDMIVTNIAGCGAMLREYGRLLRDDEMYASRASEFSMRVRDISEALVELGFQLPSDAKPLDLSVTIHDPCHLVHAQRVFSAPRALLGAIPGLAVVPLWESDTCCGAAGTYNLLQPAMARTLAERKLQNVLKSGCGVCVSGNAGCTLHLSAQSRRIGADIRFVHPVELLHESMVGASKR